MSRKGTTVPEDMMDILVGGALVFFVFLLIILFIQFKEEGKKFVIERDLSQSNADYALTTFLRMPAGEGNVADLFAQKYYGEDVNDEIKAAAEEFFPSSMLGIMKPDGSKERVYMADEYKYIAAYDKEADAKATIPTASGDIITALLWLREK